MATSPPNYFPGALPVVERVQDHVINTQNDAIDRAQEMANRAHIAIQAINDALPSLRMPGNAPTPIQAPNLVLNNLDLPALPDTAFGNINPPQQRTHTVGAIPDIGPLQIDDFNPVFNNLTLPAAPGPIVPGVMPNKPTVESLPIPSAPTLNRPAQPSMVDINIPSFTFPTLPIFDAQAPQWQGSAVAAVLKWQEKPYQIEILDEQMEVLRRMWAGGTGLPLPVEQAMWERAANREDLAMQRETAQAMTEFSGRGYTLPPGALVSRVDSVRQEAGLRKIGLGREVMIKVADTHIENLRFACTQAIASEQVLISIWSQMAERAFQAAKAQLDSELALLNAQIAIFNAAMSAYNIEAQVYKTRLDAALAHVQVYKAQIDAEVAKGQINEQRVRMYEAMTKAMLADVEVYKARMEGVKVHSDIQKNRIDMYRAEVSAWAEELQAKKLDYDVYKVQVEGETAKAGLLEAQARGYAAYVQGKSALSEVAIKNQQAVIAREEMRLKVHMANIEADKVLLQQQSAVVQANVEGHKANTQRFVATAQAQTALAQAQVSAHESTLRTNTAIFETQMRRYIADGEQIVRTAALQIEALKTVAQTHATLAAGAMAGISLGANISGTAGISASMNDSYQVSKTLD